ncbi:MAG: TonB-dependent receptor [Chitinophagaceae bacterium]
MKKRITTSFTCSFNELKHFPNLHFKKTVFFSLLVMLGIFAAAQSRSHVTGVVKDDKGVPAANVTVVVKGSSKGVTTNSEGVFSIDVTDPKSTLVVSYIGFTTQEIPLENRNQLDVSLVNNNSQMDAVVVVGYGTQKKVTVTGSVATVKGTELQKSPAVNLSNSLVGRLPGVQAINSSGEPGFDGSRIRIRGTNTLGNNNALIVIDGVPDRAGGLDRLNPADIETMSVLKDASAAIYGARAANGVILITTKHGKTGKPVLSYDFNQGWSQATRIPDVADAAQYAEMNNELTLYKDIPSDQWAAAWDAFVKVGTYKRTDGVVKNAAYTPADIQKYNDGSDPWGHPNTDWFGLTLKNWSPQVRHNLQISGGSETVKYIASLGYQNQDGYYKNSARGYKQYDFRFNLDAKVNQYINTSLGLTAREEGRFAPTESAGSIFRMLMRGKPTEQEIYPNGLPGPDIENGQNPIVITTNATGYDKDDRDYFQINGKVDFTNPWVSGLKLSLSAAADKYILRGKRWATPWTLYNWDKVSYEADGKTPKLQKSVRSTFTDPRLTQREDNQLNINLTGLLSYDKTLGDHSINLLAGITKETIKGDNFNAFRRYFISPAIDQLFAGGAEEQSTGGGAFNRARLSYFGRAAYNYKEKYLAEFLWRYDGSYIFPKVGRFGFFPGILVGWNISEEDFFKKNVPFVDNLKLRGSYGQLGNDQVFFNGALQEYAYLATYRFGTYIIDDKVQKSLFESRVPNLDFTWEVANNADIGLEGTLLNGHVNFEADVFLNKRSQISIQKQGSTPASSGIDLLLPPVNLGKVENKGWELKVGYNGQKGDFRYSVSVNGGYAKNKIVFWDETSGVPTYQQSTGKPIGTFLAYQYDGIFTTQGDIDKNGIDYSAATGKLLPGDMRFKDINGDNKINGDDRVRLEKSQDPTFTGGASINVGYKNFDLSVLFQGATGGLLFFGTESGDIGNYLKYSYDNQWTVTNPSTKDPRIANRGGTYYTGGGFGNNTYYLRNSNYVRLKNLEIGYNLSSVLGKRVGISSFRIYANGLNLITWDKMKIWDPESTSGSGQYYPQARLINTGIRVSF